MAKAVDLAGASPRAARIALVDDDPVFLRLFAANLQAAGYRTECFDDPKQALAGLLREVPPDACVFDWNMPGLDGLQLFNQLRARDISVPVLFLTSYGQPIFEEAALDAGAADFVDKSRGPQRQPGQVGRTLKSAICCCRRRRSVRPGVVAACRSAGTSSTW
jgi:CheY-like chemotaxis protein